MGDQSDPLHVRLCKLGTQTELTDLVMVASKIIMDEESRFFALFSGSPSFKLAKLPLPSWRDVELDQRDLRDDTSDILM